MPTHAISLNSVPALPDGNLKTPYEVFSCLLTSNGGGSNPTIRPLENTIGGTPVFDTHTQTGDYFIIGFPTDKISAANWADQKIAMLFGGNPTQNTHYLTASVDSDGVVNITNGYGNTPSDDEGLFNTLFEIRYYPNVS
jgi:hypothetical protein